MNRRARFLAPLVAAGAACAVWACGSATDAGGGGGDASVGDGTAGGSGSGSGSSSGSSSGSGSGASSGSGGAASASVLQFHTSLQRDGVYTDPSMTTTGTGATKTLAHPLTLATTFNPTITGSVYAQPLYVAAAPGGGEMFLVVTEQNHVMAVDGTGATLWEHPSSASDPINYGTPVTNVGTALGCGNIDPLGITGTPVIDPGTNPPTMYFDAMTLTAGVPTHKIYAVSIADGSIVSGWPVVVDTAVAGFTSKGQNERGALTLLNGTVYVPYGGHFGDCGTYYGWVVGVSTSNPRSVKAFAVASMFPMGSAAARQGGIWAVGGAASDGTALFVSTGNTGGATVWSGGEAVIRLAQGPAYTSASTNQFYPTEWMVDDQRDQDLGGANPVVFDMAGTDGGVHHLVAAPGKDGYLYVLNRDNLGGLAGQLSRTAVAMQNTGGNGSLNAGPAAFTTAQGTYVAYRINAGPGTGCPSGGGPTGGIGVARIAGNPPTATVAWCSTEGGMGSPMVTTTGHGDAIVWDASNHLYGYDGDTGAKVYTGTDTMATSIHKFNTPIDAAGRIVVATQGASRLYVFKP